MDANVGEAAGCGYPGYAAGSSCCVMFALTEADRSLYPPVTRSSGKSWMGDARKVVGLIGSASPGCGCRAVARYPAFCSLIVLLLLYPLARSSRMGDEEAGVDAVCSCNIRDNWASPDSLGNAAGETAFLSSSILSPDGCIGYMAAGVGAGAGMGDI